MKSKNKIYNILLFLIFLGSILMSTKTESPNQVIIHSNDMNLLTIQCNKYFLKGYRVKHTVAQSVASSIGNIGGYSGDRETVYGEIVIIMEK